MAGGQWLMLLTVFAACMVLGAVAMYVALGVRQDHNVEAADHDQRE